MQFINEHKDLVLVSGLSLLFVVCFEGVLILMSHL